MALLIDDKKCTGCQTCVEMCVFEALTPYENIVRVDTAKCVECGACARLCPNEALSVE